MRLRILTSVMVAACTEDSACATSIPSSSTATDSPLGGLLNSLGGKKMIIPVRSQTVVRDPVLEES